MRTLFLVCILMIGMQFHSFGQEIFIKTGINSTTYDFRSADGTKLLDFTSGMGNSIEMGMGFPFVPKSKKEGAAVKERSYSPNWLKNEVSLNLDSFNSYGGNQNNNYSWETTYGGLTNTLSFLAHIGEVELGVRGHVGLSGMISDENIEVEYDIDNKGTWRSIFVKNPIITIENPRSGNHALTIRWRSTDATTWNSQVLSYTIAYPWFAHPYMYFGYFLLLVLLIYLYVTIKTFIYVRRQRELEAEVTVKTKDLQALNTYLVGRNQAKDQVIAIMNHDILTPLKYLHITAANLELKLKDTDAVKPVGQIKATTKELEYLTSNLLSWVKFDAINELDQKQLVDVHLLFESIVDFVLPFKQSDQVGIINNIPKGLVIKGWHDPMRVLFYNLIMNSIRSTNYGLIEISAISNADVVTISIKDSGVGMSESMISYLLTGTKPKDNFVTPKYKTGNGVGYQIIRNLVKLIFAELKIVSKVGDGTEVQIVLTKL